VFIHFYVSVVAISALLMGLSIRISAFSSHTLCLCDSQQSRNFYVYFEWIGYCNGHVMPLIYRTTWFVNVIHFIENVLLGISPPGKYPKEHFQYSNHGESLKSIIHFNFKVFIHINYFICSLWNFCGFPRKLISQSGIPWHFSC